MPEALDHEAVHRRGAFWWNDRVKVFGSWAKVRGFVPTIREVHNGSLQVDLPHNQRVTVDIIFQTSFPRQTRS